MNDTDKFIQPSVVIVSRTKGPKTLLNEETLAAGRARVAAGEDPSVVATELAKYEVELIEGWIGSPQVSPTLSAAEDFDESKHERDDKGRFTGGGERWKNATDQTGRVLNGVPLKAEATPDFSKSVDYSISEPPLPALPKGKTLSAGVVMVEPDGRVWTYEPKNQYGGYRTTFSKGGVEKGEHPQDAAAREAWEETGLVPKITGHLADVERTTTVTRFYIGERAGGAPWTAGPEAHAVKLLDIHSPKTESALRNTFGRKTTDHVVLQKLRARTGQRSASSKDERPVHAAADANLRKMTLIVNAAFMRGRKAYKASGTDAAVKAIRKSLLDDLPPALLTTLNAGGDVTMKVLPKTRALKAEDDDEEDDPLGISFDATDPLAIQWAKDHALELANGISETSRDDIKAAIAAALEGDGIEGAYDVILAAVGDSDRAEMIARTETMAAANEGSRQGWDQAVEEGLLSKDVKKEWIATSDCCDDCDELDGEQVGLDEDYPNDGGDGPPLHPNCRCTEGIA